MYLVNIFGWIRLAYIDSFSRYPSADAERVPIGHGGRGETQLIMGSRPQTVRMEALDDLEKTPRWLEDAGQADEAAGRRWIEFCVQGWVEELARGIIAPAADGEPDRQST